MKFTSTVSLLLASVAVVGLVEYKKKSPTTPDIVTTTSSTVPQTPRLAIATVAPYIGQTVNSVLELALTQGLAATGANRWTRNCPSGGTGKLELSPTYQVEVGNVIMMTDTEFVLTDCLTETKGATFLDAPTLLGRLLNLVIRPVHAQARARIGIRGRVRTKGKWRAPINTSRGPEYRVGEGAHVTGSLEVNQVNCGNGTCPSQIGPIQMDCNLDGKVCAGNIGGVGVTQGPPDTAPPPNPTTTTTTTTTTVPPSGGGFTVSPSSLTLGAANWCTGNTQTGTVTVTTGASVSWTVRLQFTTELPGFNFSLSRTSGIGSGTVTITMRALRDPSLPCVGIRIPGGVGNGFFFTYSGGQQLVVPVTADLITLR